MGEQLESKRVEFVKKVGANQATFLIMQALGCSSSKAEKLAGGRYRYQICASERRALADLFDGETSSMSAS